jgi:hypothetical protein
MIEIAISLAIIGFALVAILGVLPLGLSVQKENREETVINQDANVLLNAIRNGARGMDDLANYITNLIIYNARCDTTGKRLQTNIYVYSPNALTSAGGFALNSGSRIIGLLSTPKYIPITFQGRPAGFYSNYVVAAFRSFSGPVSEKFPQDNALMQDLALSYRVISEVVPYGTSYDSVSRSWGNPMVPNLQSNLHEVRLTFRWPLAKGTNALGRQVYRTIVGGSLQEANEPGFLRSNPSVPSPYDLYFFEPRAYVQAKAP